MYPCRREGFRPSQSLTVLKRGCRLLLDVHIFASHEKRELQVVPYLYLASTYLEPATAAPDSDIGMQH
jgi:hypothetical protein